MPPVGHAVIAAAGLGSRLGHGKPKCLVEVAGATLIEHQLRLLRDVEDVRVVVGFEEEAVIEAVVAVRRDVLFVRNSAYRSTATVESYAAGARFLREPCLFMDADIFFEPASFAGFIEACGRSRPLVGTTAAKTCDAVYAHLDAEGRVARFSREEPAPLEWANLVFAPPGHFEGARGAVFERLAKDLPLPSFTVVSYEVDREEDLARARAFAADLAKSKGGTGTSGARGA